MSEDVNIEILDGGLGLLPTTGDEVSAVIGCSTLGTAASVVATRSIDNLIASRGYGPGVEGAAVALKQTGKTILYCAAAVATPGSVDAAAGTVITGATNASPIVLASTAHGLATGDGAVVAGVTGNTAANGTWIVDVVDADHVSLRGSTGNSAYVSGGTLTATGVHSVATGTSKVTVTGTPSDRYDAQVVFTTGGTRGTAGAKFKFSLDNGESFSAIQPLGTATSYAIPNSGITINFAAGTFVAGDVHSFSTTGPKWNVAGVQDCIKSLGRGSQKFRLIHLVGDLDAADALTIDGELDALAVKYRYTGLLGHARDFKASDATEQGWADAINADFASFTSTRVSVAAGHYQVNSPISGRKYRRPLSFPVHARLMGRPIQEHAGRVRTGALKGIASSATDGKIYHDEFNSPMLDVGRFLTARTRIGRPGWHVKEPRMMAAPGSDFQIWPYRSVVDKVCDLTYEVLVDVLNDDLQLDETTGFILEKEAKAIESKLRSVFRDGILAKRAASGVTAVIGRSDNIISTKTITAAVRVIPKGYVDGIDVSVGFTNPALEAS